MPSHFLPHLRFPNIIPYIPPLPLYLRITLAVILLSFTNKSEESPFFSLSLSLYTFSFRLSLSEFFLSSPSQFSIFFFLRELSCFQNIISFLYPLYLSLSLFSFSLYARIEYPRGILILILCTDNAVPMKGSQVESFHSTSIALVRHLSSLHFHSTGASSVKPWSLCGPEFKLHSYQNAYQ